MFAGYDFCLMTREIKNRPDLIRIGESGPGHEING